MERLEIPQPEQALDESFKPASHPLQLSFGEDGNVAFQTENNGQEQNFRSQDYGTKDGSSKVHFNANLAATAKNRPQLKKNKLATSSSNNIFNHLSYLNTSNRKGSIGSKYPKQRKATATFNQSLSSMQGTTQSMKDLREYAHQHSIISSQASISKKNEKTNRKTSKYSTK